MSDPEFLFIGGCPRSGTSLLSSLMGNLNGVGVVQDLTALFQLKRASLYVMFMLNNNGVPPDDFLAYALMPDIDLRQTEFFAEFMDSTLDECLNSFNGVKGQILRYFLRRMDLFLFHDFNKPDPRKDRGQGSLYLRGLDFDELLEAGNMAAVFRSLLCQTARNLSDESDQSDFSLIREKTPENLANLDVISMVVSKAGYKFLHLVRDPVSVYGARRQRVDQGVDQFVQFFLKFSEPSHAHQDALAWSFVRYEDLVQQAEYELERIIDELALPKIVSVRQGFVDEINPGKYAKYVGSSIDKDRDISNRKMVSEEESSQIYGLLAKYCEKYGYGPYSKSR